ncbi:MAG: phosphatidate cytidylyltransferase [Deinococcales bacterium]|nr:phosphatidate cytidylyltransferase [Chitinophagaceae bacterium]
MKKQSILVYAAIASMVTLSSCEIIGSIFKAGIWTGVLLVAAVIGLIIYLISAITKRK